MNDPLMKFSGGADMGHRNGDDVRGAATYALRSLERVYGLLNAFAKGDTQRQHCRVEPIGVLGQVYGDLAPAFQRLASALKR